MISTDRKIFERDSAVQDRIIEYGNLVDELHIIIFSESRHDFGVDFLSTKGRQKIHPKIIRKGGTIQILNTNVYLYSTNSINRWFYIFDAVRIGLRIIGNWKSEIENTSNKNEILVTCQDSFETGLTGWLIAKKFGVKLQLQIHTDFLSKYFVKNSFLNKIRVIMAKFLLPKADGVRVVSERIKKAILASPKSPPANKITVLPIFVDIEKIKNTQPIFNLHQKYPQFDFIFLVASRLEKEKNVDFIIDAFAEVIKKHPKVGLVIVGEGSQKINLDTQCLNVVFEGWQENLISYYKTADLFLSASSYEGFGMSLVEAGISGCQILTTNVGIVGEILNKENSLICDVGDKKCFTEKMIYAVENRKQLENFSQKAQQSIENILIKDKQRYLEEYKKSWQSCF